MMNEVFKEKEQETSHGSKKGLNEEEEKAENKENERKRRKSKSKSKGLKQKGNLACAILNDLLMNTELETAHASKKSLKDKAKDNVHEKGKMKQNEKGKICKNDGDDFKDNPKEKRLSKSKSLEVKKITFDRSTTFKEEPEDQDFLTIQTEAKSKMGSRAEDANDIVGTTMNIVVKDKEPETSHVSKKSLNDKEDKLVNLDNKKLNENQEKSSKNNGEKEKGKKKSKTKSKELKQKDFNGPDFHQEKPASQDLLTVQKDGKRDKRQRSEDTDEIHRSKIFKEEAEDQDFLTIPKEGKSKKRLRAEGSEEALGARKKKKIKNEKIDHEIQPSNKQSEEEIEPKKERIKQETEPKKEIKPKKENEEGNQEPKKKKTKEERDSATALKVKKKEEEEQQRWRWWEEQKYEDGVKWMFLEHKGPIFAPPHEPLPVNVKFYYDGKPMEISPAVEEVASFFAKMLDHDYTTKDVFRKNFFMDFRKEMTLEERMVIVDMDKCDFTEMFTYYKGKMEEKKNISKEQKLINKEANEKDVLEFGFCIMDHHRERIGNFKVEPPGLFRGRGDHPKQGMLKKRIPPEDVIINCSKDSKIPEPPAGHKWKDVRHDNTVTWLASWTENVQGAIKYVMLNASSRLKGEKDWEKYEIARKLKVCVDKIRVQYREDWKSKEMSSRQRAVALYFIDKLALRAGNEKEEGESADTVGCCSLRVEHIKLYPELDGEKHVVEFDFPGKDSIRYYNKVPVEKQVFKNLQLFLENKQDGDDLFDRLNTPMLNKHLQSLMEGLTAKVFRTYNASITLQQQLKELTDADAGIPGKILSYNRANRAVAILCNHQRAAPKTFEQSMANLQTKIEAKKEQVSLTKEELNQAEVDAKNSESEKLKSLMERKKKSVLRAEDQLMKLEVQATDREENKQVALGTSKLNYLDPRISITWCQKWCVGLEKIYNKTQRDKFAWAINMSDVNFEF